jgi:hypothetical protein
LGGPERCSPVCLSKVLSTELSQVRYVTVTHPNVYVIS